MAVQERPADLDRVDRRGVTLFSLAGRPSTRSGPTNEACTCRAGRFVGIDQPGWHIQIPFVDTVIPVIVIERSAGRSTNWP